MARVVHRELEVSTSDRDRLKTALFEGSQGTPIATTVPSRDIKVPQFEVFLHRHETIAP